MSNKLEVAEPDSPAERRQSVNTEDGTGAAPERSESMEEERGKPQEAWSGGGASEEDPKHADSAPRKRPNEEIDEENRGKSLPVEFLEAMLRDKVRDAKLINELIIYIPFLTLFLVLTLQAMDIRNTSFAIGAMKDVSLNDFYPGTPEMNRTMWTQLQADGFIDYDADTRFHDSIEMANWQDWISDTIRKFYFCTPEQLTYESALDAVIVDPVTALADNATYNNGTFAPQLPPCSSFNTSNSSNASMPPCSAAGTAQQLASTLLELLSMNISMLLGDNSGLQPRGWLPQPLRGQITPIGSLRLRTQWVRNDSCNVNEDVTGNGVVLSAADPNVTNSTPVTFTPAATCYAKQVDSSTEQKTSPMCDKVNPLDPLGPRLFEYQECGLLDGVTTTTELARYHCGGYVVDIPFNLSCTDALRMLYQVTDPACPFFDDKASRMFMLEYFAYVPQLDVHVSGKHIIEITAGGNWIPGDQFRAFIVLNNSRLWMQVFDFFFLAYVMYYMVIFIVEWKAYYKAEGRILRYLADLWTILEGINVVTYLAMFILRWMWWSQSNQVNATLPSQGYPAELDRLLLTYSQMRYAISVNFLLTFLKMLKFLKISDRLAIISVTFEKAQSDVLGLLVLFTFIILGYAVSGHSLYGPQMWGFSALDRCFSTLMFMLLGELDYAAMKIVNPTLTGLYFWSFLIISFFLILNFIVAVVGDAFTAAGEEQFVAPLDVAVQQTIDSIVWSLRPSVLVMKIKLAVKGRGQSELERQMLGYIAQGHALRKLKATGANVLMVTPEDVLTWFPVSLRRDGIAFFNKFWADFYANYELLMDTDAEVIKRERRNAIIDGTRAAMGAVKAPVTEAMCARLESVSSLSESLITKMHDKYPEMRQHSANFATENRDVMGTGQFNPRS